MAPTKYRLSDLYSAYSSGSSSESSGQPTDEDGGLDSPTESADTVFSWRQAGGLWKGGEQVNNSLRILK